MTDTFLRLKISDKVNNSGDSLKIKVKVFFVSNILLFQCLWNGLWLFGEFPMTVSIFMIIYRCYNQILECTGMTREVTWRVWSAAVQMFTIGSDSPRVRSPRHRYVNFNFREKEKMKNKTDLIKDYKKILKIFFNIVLAYILLSIITLISISKKSKINMIKVYWKYLQFSELIYNHLDDLKLFLQYSCINLDLENKCLANGLYLIYFAIEILRRCSQLIRDL